MRKGRGERERGGKGGQARRKGRGAEGWEGEGRVDVRGGTRRRGKGRGVRDRTSGGESLCQLLSS